MIGINPFTTVRGSIIVLLLSRTIIPYDYHPLLLYIDIPCMNIHSPKLTASLPLKNGFDGVKQSFPLRGPVAFEGRAVFVNFGGSVEPRKKPSYFPLYWLVSRDPCNGLL